MGKSECLHRVFDYGFILTALLLVRAALFSWGSIASIALFRGSDIIVRVIIPAVIVGCIAGVIGLHLSCAWIIISTAFWGGGICGGCLSFLGVFAIVAGLLVMAAGIRYQLKTTGISLKKEEPGQTTPSPWQPQTGQPVHPQPQAGEPVQQPQTASNVELSEEPQEEVRPAGQDGMP